MPPTIPKEKDTVLSAVAQALLFAQDALKAGSATEELLRGQVKYLLGELSILRENHPVKRLTAVQVKLLDRLAAPHDSRFTDKMLAREMGLSERTTSGYLRWAYVMLGVRSRKQAVERWRKLRALRVPASGGDPK